MLRFTKRQSPSSPLGTVEPGVDDSKRKRRSASSKSMLNAYYMTFSESTRRLMWMATLVGIFFMERRRTRIRNALNLDGTSVLTGIMIETPEDGAMHHANRVPRKFTNITTGSIPFGNSQACFNMIQAEVKCMLDFPFVDLREFRKDYRYERLKQVLPLPDNDVGAVLTQRGIGNSHEDGNQDRAFILAPFYPFSNPVLSTDFFMAVFDGHGEYGHVIAQSAMDQFPVTLAKELNLAKKTSDAVHELMTQVLIHTFRKVDSQVPDIDLSGTTATVTLKLGEYLHIANVGDSRTFIVLYQKDKETTKFIYSTTPDTADVPSERERILGMGGSIYLPPPGPRGVQQSTRVFVTTVDADTNETQSFVLENSRSIGDRAVKDRGVVCEPKVASLHLPSVWQNHPEEEMFIFAATDGLLDKMAIQHIADRLAASLYREDTVSPLETIEGIILDANQIWEHSRTLNDENELLSYRDDITLAVVKVSRETNAA
jgi:serine/threonine protein phosphatase PrpC